MHVPALETDRLHLRAWREGDLPAVAAFYADEAAAKYVGGRKDPDEAWRFLALMIGHWELKGHGYYAVEERETGAFVGAVGLWESAGWPELELGYWVVPAQQGKGYAFEAAARCRDHARDTLEMPSLVSYVAPDNEPSIRLAEKLGALYEETIELLTHGPHGVYRHF
jgi:RimJ/RimL family protein N-acetyltransferase